MFGLGPMELILIGALAVMLYGKKLPEVGRSVGQTIAEFRRQWATIAKDLDVASQIDGRAERPARLARRYEDEEGGVVGSASPRFDPPSE